MAAKFVFQNAHAKQLLTEKRKIKSKSLCYFKTVAYLQPFFVL